MTPLHYPHSQAEFRYNTSLSKTRALVERIFGQWKRRFPIVGSIIRLKLETTLAVIVASAVLFNISKLINDFFEDDADVDIPPPNNDTEPANDVHADGNAVRRDITNHFFA